MPANSKTQREISPYARELGALRNRVARAVECFKKGGIILVGDDGRRENEADLVFHASAATPEVVNFALQFGRGLLCVSLSHTIADRLAFAAAPRLPGAVSHTGFTLSVDAKHNISSGISARDRSHTIQLMTQDNSTALDFVSPGHVFPIRAQDGGLFARTGHTEAVIEICKLAGLSHAAAMCEVLADDGEALRPNHFVNSAENRSEQEERLRPLPYISTVDLLWHRVFYDENKASNWKQSSSFTTKEGNRVPIATYLFEQDLEEHITFPAACAIFEGTLVPERLRIVLTNGISSWDNGVIAKDACAEVVIFSFASLTEKLSGSLSEFCDLSAREGLRGTGTAVRRTVTELRAMEFLKKYFSEDVPVRSLVERVAFPCTEDQDFLLAALTL